VGGHVSLHFRPHPAAEATKIGFTPLPFSIYDTDDTTSVLRAIIKEMNLDPIRTMPRHPLAHLAGEKQPDYAESLPRQCRHDAAGPAAKRPYIVDIYEKYVARCQRSGAMDFDDLLLQLYRLFRDNPEQVLENTRKSSNTSTWTNFRIPISCNTPSCAGW
jgi:DNA helicase-2/ATP-dependent DNA helicase PcrA